MKLRDAIGVMLFTAAGALLVGCGEEGIDETPALPELEGLEPAVAAKIRETHAQVLAERSAASWARYAKTLHAHEISMEALRAYRVAARHAEPSDKFDLLYLAGHSCVKSNPEGAVELFEEAAKLRDDYVPLHLRAGQIYAAKQSWSDARRHYSHALRLCESARPRDASPPPTSHALLGLGRVELGEGRVPEAIVVLERARSLQPEHEEVLATLVIAYTRAGRTEDAARTSALVGNLENLQGFPDPIATRMHREGVSYLALEQFGVAALRGYQFEQALAAFDRALEVRPDHPTALSNRGQALVGLGRFQEAEPLFDRILADRPSDVTALSMKAGCAMSRRDLATAASFLRRAIEADPRHVDARWNLGRVLRGLGQPAEARKHFELALEQKPDRADMRVELASLLAEEGKDAEALAEVDRVLATQPEHRKARALREKLAK